MAPRSTASLRILTDPRPAPILPSPVMGMLIFVIAEVMMFAGLISAFSIVKAGALGWPPPGQPRLPVEATAFNTAMLIASAGALWSSRRSFAQQRQAAKRPLQLAIGLGAFFVCFQGYEWIALIRHGLTLTSSTYGSFFYLIVGMHGLHALAGLAVLVRALLKLTLRVLAPSSFAATALFWYFVVALWPVLYALVYL